MKTSLLGILACPLCLKNLEFEGVTSGSRLVEGVLRCPEGHLYQVKRWIPILKRPELSRREFAWEVEFPDLQRYDEVQRKYSSYLPAELKEADRALISGLAKSASGEDLVLDVASGRGRLLLILSSMIREGAEVIGTDVDETPLRGASLKLDEQGTHGRVSLCVMDGKHLALKPRAIPCVTSLFGLDNIPYNKPAFMEVSRVLKQGGRLAMATLWLEEGSESLTEAGKLGYLEIATEERLRGMLEEAGLVQDRVEVFYEGRWPHNPMDAFPLEGDWFSHALVTAHKS
ncbi:MAG: class I SAM-dependent methyltransferase [Dehalococcoidia bacterium]|nr:class I SAM-dependent methyltransferase [Dehalococcoidia bacterium]